MRPACVSSQPDSALAPPSALHSLYPCASVCVRDSNPSPPPPPGRHSSPAPSSRFTGNETLARHQRPREPHPSMTPPDPDAEARRTPAPPSRLRHRPPRPDGRPHAGQLRPAAGLPRTDLLQAAAKAGFVGGIADWFAVTALFRHPLGIPIPHTAIIPHQKERLGRALGRFVATHVFTGRGGRRRAARGSTCPASCTASWPTPSRRAPPPRRSPPCCRACCPRVEDGRARRLVAPHRAAHPGRPRRRAGGGPRAAQPGRGRPPPGGVRLRPRPAPRPCSPARRRRCAPPSRSGCASRAAGWSAGRSAPRSRAACWRTVNAELDKIEPRRLRTARRLRRMGAPRDRPHGGGPGARRRDRRGDPPGGGARDGAGLAVGRLGAAAHGAGGRCRATRPGARVAYYRGRARQPRRDAGSRSRGARAGAARGRRASSRSLLPAAQAQLVRLHRRRWSAAGTPRRITERLELRVGKDLQYVRVNGTLVGFLVGGLLYAVLRAAFGGGMQ